MKVAREFVTSTVVGGVFVVVPLYLAILLLLKGMQSVTGLVRPIAALLPDWLPAESFFSLLLLLVVCFLVGVAVRTRVGRSIQNAWRSHSLNGSPATASFAASHSASQETATKLRGSRHSSLSRMDSLRPSSSRNSTTAGSPCSFPRFQRHLPERSTSSPGSASTSWTFPLLRPSNRSPAGDRDRRTWSRRCGMCPPRRNYSRQVQR